MGQTFSSSQDAASLDNLSLPLLRFLDQTDYSLSSNLKMSKLESLQILLNNWPGKDAS